MIWIKRILMVIGALALLTYFFPVQREQLITSANHVLKLDTPVSTNSKITVYQSQGQKGETKFSDRQDDLHHAHARIVDTAKGTTFHTTLPSSEEKKSSKKLSFSEDNERFQRQAQAVQQARMEQVIGE